MHILRTMSAPGGATGEVDPRSLTPTGVGGSYTALDDAEATQLHELLTRLATGP